VTELVEREAAEFARRVEETVVDGWFRGPPALVAAMAAAPTRAVAQAFVLEWTKFSRLFPRWVGAIVSNCPHFDVIAFEIENLVSEVVRDPAAATNHYELLVRLGVGAGLDRATIESHQPQPATVDAFDWWWRMARDDDWLLGFTAINGLEILGDRALPRRYGLAQGTGLAPDPWAATGIDEHALEFFRVSDDADAGHGRDTVAVIARYTLPGQEERVLDVLRETMARLRRMMGAMWELACSLEDA
jgi:pyrroloquinoline quinone (PQQ) biosynthesis protein C